MAMDAWPSRISLLMWLESDLLRKRLLSLPIASLCSLPQPHTEIMRHRSKDLEMGRCPMSLYQLLILTTQSVSTSATVVQPTNSAQYFRTISFTCR